MQCDEGKRKNASVLTKPATEQMLSK